MQVFQGQTIVSGFPFGIIPFWGRTRLRLQIDAEHRRDEKWGWVPAAWTTTVYNMTGDLLRTERVEVLGLRIGEPQLASEFQIRFPPDTFLFDLRKMKYYRVKPDEDMIEISQNGEPVGVKRQLFFPSNDNYNSRFALDRSNVNDNYFSRSAGQLILPGRSAARYGSHAG